MAGRGRRLRRRSSSFANPNGAPPQRLLEPNAPCRYLSYGAAIAQPVEHRIRNARVGGSSPSCGTSPTPDNFLRSGSGRARTTGTAPFSAESCGPKRAALCQFVLSLARIL